MAKSSSIPLPTRVVDHNEFGALDIFARAFEDLLMAEAVRLIGGRAFCNVSV